MKLRYTLFDAVLPSWPIIAVAQHSVAVPRSYPALLLPVAVFCLVVIVCLIDRESGDDITLLGRFVPGDGRQPGPLTRRRPFTRVAP